MVTGKLGGELGETPLLMDLPPGLDAGGAGSQQGWLPAAEFQGAAAPGPRGHRGARACSAAAPPRGTGRGPSRPPRIERPSRAAGWRSGPRANHTGSGNVRAGAHGGRRSGAHRPARPRARRTRTRGAPAADAPLRLSASGRSLLTQTLSSTQTWRRGIRSLFSLSSTSRGGPGFGACSPSHLRLVEDRDSELVLPLIHVCVENRLRILLRRLLHVCVKDRASDSCSPSPPRLRGGEGRGEEVRAPAQCCAAAWRKAASTLRWCSRWCSSVLLFPRPLPSRSFAVSSPPNLRTTATTSRRSAGVARA